MFQKEQEALQSRPKIRKGRDLPPNVSYSYFFCGRAVVASIFFGPELGRTPYRPLAVQSSGCPTATLDESTSLSAAGSDVSDSRYDQRKHRWVASPEDDLDSDAEHSCL